jgi:deoxyribose-phosphate aldolase
MIDISAVKANSNREEVQAVVKAAIDYQFISVFTLPSFAGYAKDLLDGSQEIRLGGTVGFPSGSSTTNTKAFEAEELLEIGCQELDMVINIGKLKSGLYQEVAADIQKIVSLAGDIPVKVILEVSLLSDDEIEAGSKITRDQGAAFIKTGTGWSGATTFEHIQIIKEAVEDSIQLKVAGGVRKIRTLLDMHGMGVSRFGVSYQSAKKIINEFSTEMEM